VVTAVAVAGCHTYCFLGEISHESGGQAFDDVLAVVALVDVVRDDGVGCRGY
jgi:hypothetical protein